MRSIASTLLVACALAATGCRQDGAIVVQPVEGQVNYDGKPAEGVQVFLFPIEAPSMPQIPANPSGITRADGRFSITTFKDGDGAAQGKYLVTLHWPDGKSEEESSDRLLGWYDAAHTKLNVTIKEGANALPTFEIARISGPPPVTEGIPGRN
jgi:5-hydroxyisourate hydrolase-like protein (transthyretin family)